MGSLTEQRAFLHGMLLQHSTVTFRAMSDTEVRVPEKFVRIIQPYDVRILTVLVLVPRYLTVGAREKLHPVHRFYNFEYVCNNTLITKSLYLVSFKHVRFYSYEYSTSDHLNSTQLRYILPYNTLTPTSTMFAVCITIPSSP